MKYGFWLGLIFVGIDLSLWMLISWIGDSYSLFQIILADLVLIGRTALFTALGCYYAAQMRQPSFPLLLRGRIRPRENGVQNEQTMGVATYQVWESVLSILKVISVSILGSILLYVFASPRLSSVVPSASGMTAVPVNAGYTLTSLVAIFAQANSEEIMYRLGIQTFIAKRLELTGRRYWIAVILTAGFWLLGHVGLTIPGWVILVQMFPVGIMLGWLRWKYGTGSAMLAHGFIDVAMAMLMPSLIV